MTKKVITFSDNSTHTVHYENSDDNTVVKFDVPDTENANKKQTITSHSKTDSFGRKVFDELQIGRGFVSRQFSYIPGAITDEHKKQHLIKSTATTQLVSHITLSDGRTISYEYDNEERITKVGDSIDGVTEYTYDALGQLETETKDGVTTKFEYDNYGNITAKGVVDETGEIIEATKTSYVYGNDTWKDLLTSYNGQAIEYDAQGNPVKYLGHTLTWEKGRQLKSFDGNTYTYNANGIRTSKIVNGIKHEYTLDETKILRETWEGNTLIPLYDNEDSVCGIIHNDIPYYFIKNLQGDVIAIVDKDAQTVARYSYDAWGVCSATQDSVGIATINPFRYRGYYYDEEVGLYYLQSRYYDTTTGRFINGDEAIFVILENNPCLTNMYAYCENLPTMLDDPSGCWVKISTYNHRIILSFLSKSGLALLRILSNYLNNREYEFSSYVYGQNNWPINKMRYGCCKMSSNGCELIAIYNVAKKLGKHRQLYKIALEFEFNGAQILGGIFGTDSQFLGSYLSAHKFKYKKKNKLSDMEDLVQSGRKFILSFWCEAGKITKGLHTVAICCNSVTSFTVYNKYNSDTSIRSYGSLSEIIGKGKFICGYYVYT